MPPETRFGLRRDGRGSSQVGCVGGGYSEDVAGFDAAGLDSVFDSADFDSADFDSAGFASADFVAPSTRLRFLSPSFLKSVSYQPLPAGGMRAR
jgi:hypothetical protein